MECGDEQKIKGEGSNKNKRTKEGEESHKLWLAI